MTDYIIVGFGLAGLHIAKALEEENKSFIVLDQNGENASKVSGGLMNPLILKRYTKAWRADIFIPQALKTYTEFEKKLDIKIVHPTPLFRKLNSVQEQNDWFVASDKRDLENYMAHRLEKLSNFKAPFGFGEVLQSAIIDIRLLIKSYREHLQNKNSFREEIFDFNLLQIHSNKISYKDLKAKKIIFCEGSKVNQNPFFKDLPIIGNKGEFLIFKSVGLKNPYIIKSAYALIPLGNDLYKFGATFSNDFPDENPEEENRNILTKRLKELIEVPFEIQGIAAGIRPTVLDRRPLLGRHPHHSELLICNGFGTHGIMMASSMAQLLIDSELKNIPLPKKLNVQRYLV